MTISWPTEDYRFKPLPSDTWEIRYGTVIRLWFVYNNFRLCCERTDYHPQRHD